MENQVYFGPQNRDKSGVWEFEATGISESQGVGKGEGGGGCNSAEEAGGLQGRSPQLDNTTPPSEMRNGGLREGYIGGGGGKIDVLT